MRAAGATLSAGLWAGLLLLGCQQDGVPSGAPATSATTSTALDTTSVAPTPAPTGDVDRPFAARDTSPLPADAFLRFQSISHGPDPRTNHRWVLYDDGRLHLAFHSGDTAAAVPFDTPLPSRPTRTLATAEVAELRDLIERSDFLRLPALLSRQGEGGMWQVVTARVGDRIHEVIFDRARHPVGDRLQRIASQP